MEDTTINNDATSTNAVQPTDIDENMEMQDMESPTQDRKDSLGTSDEETTEPEMSGELEATDSENTDDMDVETPMVL